MEKHYIVKHPDQPLPSKFVVVEFEKKSVEYVSLNGYLPDKKYEKLRSDMAEETVKLFGDRKKEKEEKKKKRKQKSGKGKGEKKIK